MSNDRSKGVCIVSFPLVKAFSTPLASLVGIMCSMSPDLYAVIGRAEDVPFDSRGNRVKTEIITYTVSSNAFIKILRYLHVQLKITRSVLKFSDRVGCYLFYVEEAPLLPMLVARGRGKKILWKIPARTITNRVTGFIHPLAWPLFLLAPVCYRLSDALILYSWRLVDEWELGGYREKIRILAEHSIDTCEFSPVKKLNERDLVLGYVGRLSTEKGILNFLDSIPLILREHPRARVLIIGDGPLRDKVSEYLAVNRLVENVKMIGWVPHEDLPRYFNELKLLVLPSYTEGFPFVLLEAMACGVPVLATPVGAVPDVIEDRVTGFLMENNSGGMHCKKR